MDVHLRNHLLDGMTDIEISLACVLGMDATLQTNLCRPSLISLSSSPHNFIRRQIVRPPPEIFAHLTFGKCAKLAFEVADVGVIVVAINAIRDDITD